MNILGLFGHPVGHSLSPAMHQAALKSLGLDKEYVYLAFDIPPAQIREAVDAIRLLNFRGANITIPHKESVVCCLDRVDDLAARIGAVNVILNRKGILIGFNTDGTGFLQSLTEVTRISPKGKKILIVGAGGASRAVSAALASAGAGEIFVLNRTKARAQGVVEIIKDFGVIAAPLDFISGEAGQAVQEAEIIVNTTSVGMRSNPGSPLGEYSRFLREKHTVCDIVYNPLETLLLKQAREKGCRTMGGIGMLLYQGVEAFKIWTALEPPEKLMYQVLLEKVGSFQP